MIYEIVKGLSKLTTSAKQITTDIIMLDFTIVKAYMVRMSNSTNWVLIDTGLENSYDFILTTAKEYFGENSRPKAILLTHGHFDHIGSVQKLADTWNMKVYAHELELPYLTGRKDYPKGDPSADEGLIAKMSSVFPNSGIDLGSRITALEPEGRISVMEGWEWIHTPGHCEGHVSFFRDTDKVLIVGDAFTTTKQESLLSVISGIDDVKGPPAYLTQDWVASGKSVLKLKNLYPSMALPSHGDILKGEDLAKHLQYLINHYEEETVPEQYR